MYNNNNQMNVQEHQSTEHQSTNQPTEEHQSTEQDLRQNKYELFTIYQGLKTKVDATQEQVFKLEMQKELAFGELCIASERLKQHLIKMQGTEINKQGDSSID